MIGAGCGRGRAERAAILVLSFLVAPGCNGSEPTGTPADTPTHATAHFDFVLYDALRWDQVRRSLEPMETEYQRITDDLQVPSLPRVRVEVWASRATFEAAMQATLGVTYRGATGYVLGTTGVRLLLNENTARESVHEFAHVVSLDLNPTIANNPRWLWEAVAVYEADQFVDPHSLPYLVQGDYPTLVELNTAYNEGGQKIYEVGYLLSEFVVFRWGRTALVDLIRTNGSTTAALGLFQEDFQEAWHEYVRDRYFRFGHAAAGDWGWSGCLLPVLGGDLVGPTAQPPPQPRAFRWAGSVMPNGIEPPAGGSSRGARPPTMYGEDE